MNVLSVLNLHPKKYGSLEKYCVYITNQLISQGHSHYIIFNGEPCEQVKQDLKQANIHNNCFGRLGFKDGLRLLGYVKKYKIDVVHLHFYPPYSLFSLLIFFFKTKCYITHHLSEDMQRCSSAKNMVIRIRNRVLGLGINKIFCISKYIQEIMVNNYQERRDKTAVIYNALDVVDYDKHRVTRENKDGPVRLIAIGNLIEEKGFQYLIKAIPAVIKNNEKCELIIVGEGYEGPENFENELKELVITEGVEKYVFFLGLRSDVPQLLMDADIMVVPSIWGEGFGLINIEAMAAHLSVVATNVGAIPEIVIDNETGILVEPKNEETIAAAINKLVNDKKMRERMGAKGYERVKKFFSLEKQCQELFSWWGITLTAP
ncbi:MAG: glycosyltransferase family 4 protein [Bacteroidetes bacterium]|nr:glycosyltransferase family 4 protein [Bacteroidota bacterium]